MSKRALGIINIEPSYVHVEGIEDYRPISATSFMGRYRIIDFILSNLTNSGVNNIEVQVKNRPRSTIQHIQRTDYNINTKRGHIRILHGEKPIPNEIYNTDVASLMANLKYFEEDNSPYVILAPSHFIYVQDFSKMLDYHIESKNDITVLYQNVNTANEDFLMCDTLDIDENKVITNIDKNLGKGKRAKVSLETYIMSKKIFIDMIYAALSTSSLYSLSDIIADGLDVFKIGGYLHTGYAACISTLNSYYKASMDIKNEKELSNIFSDDWPIYTATNDTCPTTYTKTSNVSNCVVGNGCVIEGTVENCILFRGVKIGKGAVVKNCVLMQDTVVESGVKAEYTITDKNAVITSGKELKGADSFPIYIAKYQVV